MRTSDSRRLQNQVSDAAKRLHRITRQPAVTFALHPRTDGGLGFAFAGDNISLGEIEFGVFMLLNQLARDLTPGAAEGCEGCSAAYMRVTSAIEILRPGFDAGAQVAGRC